MLRTRDVLERIPSNPCHDVSVITATIVLRNLEEIKIQYVDNKDSSVPTYKASVDILRVISARMTNPSRKIPVSGEYAVVYTEQDSLSFDDTKAITVLDGLRRCDCMKFAGFDGGIKIRLVGRCFCQ